MADAIITRLQTPEDPITGARQDIDFITSAKAVIVDDKTNLDEKLKQLGNGVTISSVKPDYPCLWAQIVQR